MRFLIIFYIIIAMLFFNIEMFVYAEKVDEHENILYLLMFVTSMVWPIFALYFFINRLKNKVGGIKRLIIFLLAVITFILITNQIYLS